LFSFEISDLRYATGHMFLSRGGSYHLFIASEAKPCRSPGAPLLSFLADSGAI
jgi:hypothetical protein